MASGTSPPLRGPLPCEPPPFRPIARARAVTARPHPLRARHHIIAPSLRIPDAAAASVFAAVRLRGPVARDVIAQLTELSIATVNRQVIALLDAGLLRERADLAVSGAIGRPRVPVEVNHEPFLTLGIHVGARTTSIVATDLFGRTLDAVETPTPRSAAGPRWPRWPTAPPLPAALASAAAAVGRRRDRWCGRQRHAAMSTIRGWAGGRHRSGRCSAEALGLPVSVASHVDAMAGAELLLGMRRFAGQPRRPACTCTPARRWVMPW